MSLVYLKNKKNGITYVYESAGYWDKEKQQARNHRTCIGKLDPTTGELIPSKKRVMDEAPQLRRGPVPTLTYKRLFYGATYLLDAIGEKLGVTADLQACFPDAYKQILSMAYYLILEDRNPMSRFSKWALTHAHPFVQDIPSQRSSECFAAIQEDAKQQFFFLQGKRRSEHEFLAYDTTSISSYSQSLKQVKYGRNKDHDPLPQMNLVLVCGETSRLPVYYRKLPGNITDVQTVHNVLADLSFLELSKVQLVMDRGFYSEDNLNALYQHHYKFLIGAKTSLKFIKNELDAVRDTMISRSHYSVKYGLYYVSIRTDWSYTEQKKRSGETITDTRRIYLHLFYNDQRATDDKMNLHNLLNELEDELRSGKRSAAHEKLYTKYYEIKETPVRGLSLTPKQQAIDEALKYGGYFALLSNGIKDPLDALDIYRSKDMIEKAFGNLKERLNMRRTSVSSEESLEGKLFVQFVALIFLSYIQKAMSDHDLFKTYTMQELLDELDIIERFERPGRRPSMGEMTKKQRHLYQCLGVDAPS